MSNNSRSSNSNSKGISLGFGIGIAVIVIAVIALIVYMYVRRPSTSSSSSRKYTELQSSNKSGKCDAKGTVSKDVKSSDDCASACDADSTPCNGYDWNGTTCTLYADAPTKVLTSTKDKCYVPVLTK